MFRKFQLKNSLNVILAENHKSPVVSVQMWVKTGSADEIKGLEGISHFIEHLVFKGTRNFNVGEIASKVEGSGGQLNAYTSFDQTVFYVTISKSFLDVGLEVVSEMMGHPIFDADEIDNGEVVIEEIKRGFDSPHRVASQSLFSTVYKNHPYSIPVIGYDKNIKKMSREDIVDYYNQRYVPENMTLVISGDFQSKEIKKKVQHYFSDMSDYKLKKVIRKKDIKQTKPVIKVTTSEFNENLVYFSWKVPKVTHKDIPAIDVLALVFGQGESSRLNKRMKIEEDLANYVGASTFTPIDAGFFAVSASLRMDTIDEFLDSLLLAMEDILTHGPTKEEMIKAKINLESEEYYSMETVDGLARKVGTYDHLFEDYKYFKVFLKDVLALSSQDVLKAARKYFKPETLSISMLTNQDEKELKVKFRKWVKKYEKLFAALKKSKKAIETTEKRAGKLVINKPLSHKTEEKLEKIKLSSGATIILKPSYETPVVNVRCAFLGGLRAEQEGAFGVTELLSRVWASRSQSMDEKKFSHFIESRASGLSSFGGRNTVGVNMTTLSGFSQEIRELYFDILLNPCFEEAIIAREKALMKEVLLRRADKPAQQTILKFMQTLYTNAHPYSRDLYATEAEINALNEDKLRAYLNKIIVTNNLTMVLAGAFDRDEWLEYIENRISNLKKGNYNNQKYEFKNREKTEYIFDKQDKNQTHVVYGFNGLTFKSKDRHTLEVIQAILAGQGGRLFLELRDKASLAYSVSPIKMEGIDAGHFGVYIGCSPEKAKTAIRMIKEELSKLANNEISDAELDRAKRYLIGQHDISLQKTTSVTASILFDDIYGVDYTESFNYGKIVNKITAKEVQSLAKNMFSQNEVVCVVGAEKPF